VARRSSSRPAAPINGLTAYPGIKLDRIAPPPAGPAIAFRSCQLALWKRLLRALRVLGVMAVCFGTTALLAVFWLVDSGWEGLLIFVLVVVGFISLIVGVVGLTRTLLIVRLLRQHEWSVYTCENLSLREGMPVTMTLVRGQDRFPIKFPKTRRAETLRGMVRPEIWYVGEPAGRGILTPAGGGEMFLTRPYRAPVAKPYQVRKPPRKIKPVSVERQRKQAAQQRAKQAAALATLAAKAKAKPATPVRQPKPLRQPKVPKIRGGQKIKWQ
jgi:hypothetical protein